MEYAQLTTAQLVDVVKADPSVTERELVLLDRLLCAIDEIETLAADIARAHAGEVADADARG